MTQDPAQNPSRVTDIPLEPLRHHNFLPDIRTIWNEDRHRPRGLGHTSIQKGPIDGVRDMRCFLLLQGLGQLR